MKKKQFREENDFFLLLNKLILMARITIVLMILGLMQVSANSYSQAARINLKVNDATLADVFDKIEQQSEYRFFYNNNQVDLSKKMDVDYKNQKIDEVLNNIFSNTDISYEVLDRHILIRSKKGYFNSGQLGELNISGTVISSTDGSPIPGVSVVLKGTNQGTVTNIDGRYSIEVDENNSVLIFSFIGMRSQEVLIGGRQIIDITMVDDVIGVDEVVVIGYGTRSKRDVTTAISSITTESLDESVSMSAEMAMQGRMTGVLVSGNSGNPMARPNIKIRGVNTWGVSSPLYIIDGIPITEFGAGIEGQEDARASDVRGPINIMAMIDPNDIESISVLKDASAAAIYGVRAANGVVLITTKKGKLGKPSVEFSSRYGFQNITQKMDVLNTQQYVKHVNDVFASDPTITIAPENEGVFDATSPKYLGNSTTYDWQESLKNKNAPTQDYSLRISGGTEGMNYYVSLGYANTKGTLIGSNLERLSGSFKFNSEINSWLKAGMNYRISSTEGKDNDFRVSLWESAQTPPWQPIYDPNGPSGYAPTVPGLGDDGIYRSDKLYGAGTRINVPGMITNDETNYKSMRNMGNIFIEIEPVKHLKIKAQASMDIYVFHRYEFGNFSSSVFNYTSGDPRSKGGGQSVGSYGERDVYNNNYVQEITANYANSFGDHNIDVLVNGMNQVYDSKYTGMSTDYMTTTLDYLRKLGGENEYTNLGSDVNRWALSGMLGRVGYNYKYKYYLDLTVRRDGSARFSPENRWGTFPSASAAWRVKNESFMENVAWLDDLKLRAGWGQLGNQEVRNMAYLSPIATNPTFAWGYNPEREGYGYFSSSATVFALANPGLRWEKTSTLNLGFDALMLKNLTLSFEYYDKKTSGILQEVSLPNSVGVTQQPVDNIAAVSNSGFELSLGYSNKIGKLNYAVNANLTTVKNVVDETYNHIPLWNIEEGYPMFYVKGYKLGGIFQTEEEVSAWLSQNEDVNYQNAKIAPGDMYFQDLKSAPEEENEFYSEKPDNKIDSYDQVYLGKSIPGYFYGINLSLAYEGFDMVAQLTGVGDVVKYNPIRQALEYTPGTGNNLSTAIFDSWTPQNTTATMPRVIGGDPANNFRNSDYFVENASYLRLSNIQLGYTLPESFYEFARGNVRNIRIYAGASNLFTITEYTGFDPENDKYPEPRVFFMGLNVKF